MDHRAGGQDAQHPDRFLAIGARFVYVADTNAHRIAIVKRADGHIQPLVIER